MLDKQAQRASMNRGALDAIEREAVSREQLRKGRHGKVAQMLVVHRVEFAVLEKIEEIRNLDHGRALLREHEADSLDESVQVRNVREHVVREDDVGSTAFG